MSKSRQATKSVIIIIILSLGSKVLGFVREALIASKFGSGIETDTFFVAITATGLITSLIGMGLNTTMIPVLAEVEEIEGKKGKIEHANNMLNILFVISIFLLMLGWIISPFIIKILAQGFVGDQFSLAVKLVRIGLPVILFSTIVNIFRGYLQSEMLFIESAAANFPLNFVYIFFLVFLSGKFGIKGLMTASALAVAAQITIQIPGLIKTGFRYKYIFNIRDKYVKKILLLTGPVFIGVAINDLNAIIDRTLASSLVGGSISALNYANILNSLVLGVFISAITTVIFPILSKESYSKNYHSMKKIMGYGVNIVLIITVPATVGLIVLSKPIVQVAFERGAFDTIATTMTSKALMFYSIGLIPMSLQRLLIRVYYSLQDTKTPMVNGAISAGFNIALSLVLVRFMAHAGLALATSIAITIATFLLLYGLKKKIGSLGTKSYITTFIKTGLASMVMGLISYLIYHKMYGILGISKLYNMISLFAAAGVGVIVYLLFCYIFKVKEVRGAVRQVKARFTR